MKKSSNILTDNFGRFHNYLRISLTERCNLKCFYCMPDGNQHVCDKTMTADEIIKIATEFVKQGVTKIRLTGGEPLLRKEAGTIIEAFGKLPVDLHITTNGILIDRYIEQIKASRIKEVNLSLDTLDRDKFKSITKQDQFDRVFNNVHLLLDNNIKVKLNVVAMKDVNDQEFFDLIELTKTKPLDVRFIEFMPFDGNSWDWSKGISLEEMRHKFHERYGDQVEVLAHKPHETSRNFRLTNYKGTFGVISSVSKPFCADCNRIRLTADGKLKNCLFSNEEVDVLTALRNGEDLQVKIQESISSKKEIRAGMETLDDVVENGANHDNRSMVRIGG